MDNWRYNRKRPLTLAELIAELEDDDTMDVPNSITIFPPDNSNDPVTDEDSGEEDVVLDNLPGSQLRVECEPEVEIDTSNDWDSDDDLPLANFVRRKPKKFKEFSYTKQDLTHNSFPVWAPVQNIKHQRSPATLFKLFFDDTVMTQILEYTNLYARQKNRLGDVTIDELFSYIGIMILSGYSSVSRRKMYWQNSDDTNNKLVAAAISRDRFQFLTNNIHFNDNSQLTQGDKFSKLRPLFDSLNNKFHEYAPIEEYHSVDEAMVPYFGRHGCKQFIRGKPILQIVGTNCGIPEEYSQLGLGSAVVLKYADVLGTLPYGPFHLFFDNYFTSLSLMRELKLRNVKATGTIKENRIPSSPLQSAKDMKKKDRGSFDYALADNDIIICKWHDNSVVSLASNASSVFPLGKAKRYSQSEKKHVQVDQPCLIKLYNENMGGVDRSDQNIGQYRTTIRGKKWYFPLWTHSVDMAVQNAWHLQKLDGGTLDQLSFRRSIAMELLETHKRTTKRGPSKTPKNQHEHSRYDGRGHLVVYSENQRRCALCHKRAKFLCDKCQVALHPKECFFNYHTV
ncbi:piggyBac transposable element-derived protein 3-like [Sitophilus oryzae]|uniref:PiggyBac transposable element-derived protein 3-like n=1 Tax=Sitophilus oryzae TaxID=7048 RepID=A0A6J2Y8W3_SITOR|nr:piggyBac transposable element-derived protein 3-like [Sitophilus oryzae]